METLTKIIIAVDGHSSTGKSTIAKSLAKQLDYTYIDTGAMYRSVSLFALQQGLISNGIINKNVLIKQLPQISITFKKHSESDTINTFLNGKNVEKEIRSLEISNYVSDIATITEVRKLLVNQQQIIGKEKGIVMDGRDIGTVVFPNAELKLFITASAEVRAKRRYKELIENGEQVTYEAILENVQKRDYIDMNRKDSPLIKAKDAHYIDNSTLSKEEQMQLILDLVKQYI